ncbi:SDR family oxidoreductase [Pseudomonas sp. Marseille-Q5117]|uniref:SDR family oxidoreductase n=1 Tax=Pseudomonas sp. Marseille-Q5117 TaxID=2972777 RepID=UPI0021C5C16F|nr:SDR family oxidoreductase [Pseudomonas sp. Marseille-Q5117]
MTIAITGATGQLGRLVVNQLKMKSSNEKIVALVRDREAASSLGVEARSFDYETPDKLASALNGVEVLLLISSNAIGQRVRQHANVIRAAKEAGVRRIVYTSLLSADTSPLSLAAEHVQTEADLKASGVVYTVLRNGWYTENYTASVPAALTNEALYGSAGTGRISSAPRKDYAEAATVVLTTNGHEGKTYELAGDHAYTLQELAAEISKQIGRAIPYVDIPEKSYAEALIEAGVEENFAKAIASWDDGASKNALYSSDKSLSKIIGHPTTALSSSVRVALAQK